MNFSTTMQDNEVGNTERIDPEEIEIAAGFISLAQYVRSLGTPLGSISMALDRYHEYFNEIRYQHPGAFRYEPMVEVFSEVTSEVYSYREELRRASGNLRNAYVKTYIHADQYPQLYESLIDYTYNLAHYIRAIQNFKTKYLLPIIQSDDWDISFKIEADNCCKELAVEIRMIDVKFLEKILNIAF